MASGSSGSPRKSLQFCTKCLHLKDKLKALSCLHTFCQDCIKKWAQEHLNSLVKCPYCSKVTCLPMKGVRALPDHFHVKPTPNTWKVDLEVEKKKAKEPEKPQKPKDLTQIHKEWNEYFQNMKDELTAAFKKKEEQPEEGAPSAGNAKDRRKIASDLDRMYAQTAIQRALVAGDIIKANIAISKGESPPDVEVTEECFNHLLHIHKQKVEQVDFAIEHTEETKKRFELNVAKLKKDLRQATDELIGQFAKQAEADFEKNVAKLGDYERESMWGIEAQLTQLIQQKNHIEKVLDWAPMVRILSSFKISDQ